MTISDPLLDSLRAAVQSAPDDAALRLHLAELLLTKGAHAEAVGHIAAVLAADSHNAHASQLMQRALGGQKNPTPSQTADEINDAPDTENIVQESNPFDWSAAESQLKDSVPPPFVEDSLEEPERVLSQDEGVRFDATVEESTIRLADVGGMSEVKKRLNAAFLEPMRNPKLRELFGKSLRGGLLLYGPPGCGKTFIAKAIAGELGANFLSIGLNDVLDMWLGKSESNMHNLFVKARRNAPCVLFFDELDGIGQKRSQLSSGGSRNVVNQLLTELDGVNSTNEGVFVLAATNAPWDVDVALRRPGRFDRTVLVLPPDEAARRSILEYHLKDRPIAGINLDLLARKTDGLSGADLAYLCEVAAERALMASVESGEIRMIEMNDLLVARQEISSTTGGWFAAAQNVALFANTDGFYDELIAHMKKLKML